MTNKIQCNANQRRRRLRCCFINVGTLIILGFPYLVSAVETLEHVDQLTLLNLIKSGENAKAFTQAFDMGDELFTFSFGKLDGGGANVGEGMRYTRLPRADLRNSGEWATHIPRRSTGPNGDSCVQCHNFPVADGAGGSASNVIRDPLHSGEIGKMVNRQAPHLLGIGVLQILAEEMTTELQQIRETTIEKACTSREEGNVEVTLTAKGIEFGSIEVPMPGLIKVAMTHFNTGSCQPQIRYENLQGVDPDLIVKPFQWKGNFSSLRQFTNDAAHNELGMQPVEMVGIDKDSDGDGVVNELTVGDITALTIYMAAQPRPTTLLELNTYGLLDNPLSDEVIQSIKRGEQLFNNSACASCHIPEIPFKNKIFQIPSAHADYRNLDFVADVDPIAMGVDIRYPVAFDLTTDQPDNRIEDAEGNLIHHLGAFENDSQGNGIARIYGDLRHWDLGPGIAESIDETGTGSSVFMTENLWGVGSTPPYLHDGRATTLTEAILFHDGQATQARTEFLAMSDNDKHDIVSFLQNLVLYVSDEEE